MRHPVHLRTGNCIIQKEDQSTTLLNPAEAETEMLISIISIVANILFFVVLNLNIYTDRTSFPDGSTREWQRSPLARLELSDQRYLFYLQIAVAAVSVITSILVICGVKSNAVKIIRNVSSVLSLIVFIIIMIVSNNTHAKYAYCLIRS